MVQSSHLCVILHVKCKKVLILTVFTWFLIFDKIQDGHQDGDHFWWRHRPPAAPPPMNIAHLVEKTKGFPLKAKLFRNIAIYGPPPPPCTTVVVWLSRVRPWVTFDLSDLYIKRRNPYKSKPFSWGLLATCNTCLNYFPSHIFSLNLFFNYIFCFPVSSLNQFIWSKLWLLLSKSCWIGFINWTKLNWISISVMRIYNGNDQPYTFQNSEVQNLRQSFTFDFSLSQDFVPT